MKQPLRLEEGDVFVFRPHVEVFQGPDWVRGDLVWRGELKLDGYPIHYTKREKKPGGWERKTKCVFGPNQEDVANVEFFVASARMSGGGCAHGPGDVYPDGWGVEAKEVGGDRHIHFYMSGCFTNMLSMDDVKVVRKLRKVVKWEEAR